MTDETLRGLEQAIALRSLRQNASSRTVRTPKSRVQVAFASRRGQLPGPQSGNQDLRALF